MGIRVRHVYHPNLAMDEFIHVPGLRHRFQSAVNVPGTLSYSEGGSKQAISVVSVIDRGCGNGRRITIVSFQYFKLPPPHFSLQTILQYLLSVDNSLLGVWIEQVYPNWKSCPGCSLNSETELSRSLSINRS